VKRGVAVPSLRVIAVVDYTDITEMVAESMQRSLDINLEVLGLRKGREPE